MSDGGKGSKPRPFSVSQDEYANRWDAIFQRDLPKEEKPKSDYQDILSTEDCMIEVLEDMTKNMRA
jgi:hypothetical protein